MVYFVVGGYYVKKYTVKKVATGVGGAALYAGISLMSSKNDDVDAMSSTTKTVTDSEVHEHIVDKEDTELKSDLEKMDFWSEMSKKKAKVTQEFAIANRISDAETV